MCFSSVLFALSFICLFLFLSRLLSLVFLQEPMTSLELSLSCVFCSLIVLSHFVSLRFSLNKPIHHCHCHCHWTLFFSTIFVFCSTPERLVWLDCFYFNIQSFQNSNQKNQKKTHNFRKETFVISNSDQTMTLQII